MNWTDFMIAIRQGLIPSKKELVDGTTKVGNADKLDGHDAEYFAPLSRINGDYLTTSILEKALTAPLGISEYKLGGDGYNGGDLPHYAWTYATAIVYKRAANSIVVMLVCELYDRTLINRYGGTTWTGWVESANTADLANYLPKTGGNVRGNINLLEDNAAERALRIANAVGTIDMLVTGGGSKGLYDRTTDKWIVRSDNDGGVNFYGTASGNFPLTGGNLTGPNIGLNNGTGGVIADDLHTGVTANDDDKNYRHLIMYRRRLGGGGEIGLALQIREVIGGSSKDYIIHHDGNSAKVAIQASAPSDTSSLWVW